MDTKKLRQKILDLAIHGKLVPQDPNDEPASVLLERIKAEKERLIKEGKIKKSKKSTKASDTPHYEIVPFELPESREWCKFQASMDVRDGTHDSPKYTQEGYPLITSKDFKNGQFDFSKTRYISEVDYKNIIKRSKVDIGDILYSMIGGNIGSMIYIQHDNYFDMAIKNVALFKPYQNSDISTKYIAYFLESKIKEYQAIAIGGAQPFVGLDIFRNTLVPLPPLAEQHRIITEIEKWLALIDQIEQGKVDLQTIIKQTKSKILDLAIHGKLVPQDPNDEPAIKLLKRINPDFTPCDNGHKWKLPQSWCWAKGRQIFLPMKSTKPHNDEFLYIDIDSIDNKRQIINKIKRIKTANAPSLASRYTQKGDVVFSMVRPYLRNIAKGSVDGCIASTGFYVCSPIDDLNSEYCYYLMISDYVVTGLNQFMKGDNSPSINKSHIDEWLFPLPPFPEQQRIVQKIEKLFSLLDHIKKSLEV